MTVKGGPRPAPPKLKQQRLRYLPAVTLRCSSRKPILFRRSSLALAGTGWSPYAVGHAGRYGPRARAQGGRG